MNRFPLGDVVRGAPVVQAAIAVNVAVFLAMASTGCQACPDTVVRFGALVIERGRVDEWWRVVTSAFVHFGAAHLLSNLFGLAIFGPDLERRLGRVRFVALYLGAATAGSVATILFARGVVTIAAGASGAVFGLLGAWLAVLIHRWRDDAGHRVAGAGPNGMPPGGTAPGESPQVRDGAPAADAARTGVREEAPGGQVAGLALYIAVTLALGASDPRVGTLAHAGGAFAGLLLGVALDAGRGAKQPPGAR